MVLCSKEPISIVEEYFHWSQWWSRIYCNANNCIRCDKHWLRYSNIWRWTPDQMGLASSCNNWFCKLVWNVLSVWSEDCGQSNLLWLLFVCRLDLFHSNWYLFPTFDGISSIWRPNRFDRRDYDEWLQVCWRYIRLGTIKNVKWGKLKFKIKSFLHTTFLLNSTQTFRKLSERFEVCENVDVCLKQLSTNDYLAVAISLEQAQHSRFMPMSEIHCFENTQQTVEYSTHVLVRKDFRFFNELNAFIDATKANGLISKWLDNTKIRPIFKYHNDDDGQITMDNFIGFFGLWFCLLCLPSTIFLIEKFSFYWAHKSNPTKISILLEMYIDADRHFLLNSIDLTGRKTRTSSWI